jgi:signal transduction histidine kinase/CheY-like chemotaxis protein
MQADESSRPSVPLPETQLFLKELQTENIALVLPALYIVGIILLINHRKLDDPLHGGIPAVILFLLPLAVLALSSSNYLASAWTLVLGCLGVGLLVVEWSNIDAAICLLALPVGLATLFINAVTGSLMAAVCTYLLWFSPIGSDADSALQATALIAIWGTTGLIWLTLRPLLTTMHWYRSNYERNRQTLEQTRDIQEQLKQTLEDLTDANTNLTRLDRLAQGFRLAAEEARRTKEEFVANVSHELRTPLNMIIGFCEMIIESPDIYGDDLPQKVLADLGVILRNSQHLSRLIDDVLDLSQTEANQIALTRERVSFDKIVQDAIIAVRPLYQTKGLVIEAEVSEDLPAILCDPTRIRQVVLNLLSNAGRFTERGGVHLRAWRDGQSIIVSVADTGPGIPAGAIDKIFQPFQQLDGSIHRRYGGSGLGLSISKRFIELHNGKIWLESEEGCGTTFFFSLPIDPPAPIKAGASRWLDPYRVYSERTRPTMAPAPVVSSRFLVKETGGGLERLLKRYVDHSEIIAVENLQEANQIIVQAPARALLVNDVSVSNTLRLIEESAGLPYGTPVIVSSVPGMHEASGALGVSNYLVKPILKNTLLSALESLELEGKNVLIVDDEPDALRLFRRILIGSGDGYRIITASNGRQALDILSQQRADVILLDLVMPRMDGFRFLEEKSHIPELRDVPVIVISARDPAGEPIVSNALAVTRAGGLSISQLLACIEAVSEVLSPPGQVGDPISKEMTGA